ncbi:hypothetical protein [Pedobacter gandavensis]|uniref:hypothetical protein n=1 Tax=Pedobacter gandavensis TaxID=2679963 RepID=UPI002931D87D|nr:hypothetical protein [Pedobacter gandavensis]
MRRRYGRKGIAGFRYLEGEELINPLLVAEEFFDTFDLELFRQELRLFFSLAFNNKAYKNGKSYEPAGQASVHWQLTRFLEMAWLIINNDKIDLLIRAEDPLYQTDGMWRKGAFIEVGKRLKNDAMKYCRMLEDAEVNNVRLVFQQLFNYLPLSGWQDELDMVLFYSLCDIPMADECENGHTSLPMLEHLEKLLECVHVIHELCIVGDEGWKVIPIGTNILNKDYSVFPAQLMMSIYRQQELIPF